MSGERVHAANFVRAESDTYFDDLLERSGGVNRWHHTREPAPVDHQPVVRMNRDTLYSSAIVDVSAGAALTLPEAGGRYQTAMVVDHDHYIADVFERPGRYDLDPGELGTAHVAIAARTFVDPANSADVSEVHALQDALHIEARSADAPVHPDWDRDSLDATRGLLMRLAATLPDTNGAFGSRQETDPIKHLLGTAAGWGGLPVAQATYIGVSPSLPTGHYTLRVPADVPVSGFWSVSVYNSDGYFELNETGCYSINSVTARRDADGAATIHFGGDAALPNAIPLPDGWNYTVRLYRPGAEILDGSWRFPSITTPD